MILTLSAISAVLIFFAYKIGHFVGELSIIRKTIVAYAADKKGLLKKFDDAVVEYRKKSIIN